MDNIYWAITGAFVGAAIMAFLVVIMLIARAGSWGGAVRGLTISGKAKQDPAFEARVQALLAGAEVKPLPPPAAAAPPRPSAPSVPPPPPKPSGAPLRMLALLQAESRLVDFLMEDVQEYTDAQIGQAVREVHKKARAALIQHAVIEPVLGGSEGDTTVVPKGFDPSVIRVVGNISGEPPFRGEINHVGWRVKELKLAPPPEGADEFVLQPAEVQIP
jgi:hypothetical protein